jgi:predicted nucleic acid-binding protein
MVVYFDTSAFLPVLVPEPGTDSSLELWQNASNVASTWLLYVEASASIARRSREKQSASRTDAAPLLSLNSRWKEFRILELGESLMAAAAQCAIRFGLRGYDAVHCAAAASINGPDVVAASSDRRLLEAWSELGLATFDPRR